MTCLSLPTSLEAADAMIVACSGVADWRPMFLLGTETATLIVVIVVAVVCAARVALR